MSGCQADGMWDSWHAMQTPHISLHLGRNLPISLAGNVYFPVKAAKGKGLVAGRGRKPLGYTELTTVLFPTNINTQVAE